MRYQLRVLVCAALLAILPRIVPAADAPAATPPAPAVPSWSDTLTAWGITVNGYVAASYYASNGYPGGYPGVPGPVYQGFDVHQFDVRHDTFQLDEAGLQVAYQPKQGFGALIDVIAGEDARILHEAEDNQDNTFDIRQAFIQYATGPLTVIAGKYVTLAGAEVINPTGNTNFSRSLLFTFAEPLTHTGVRATWALSDAFSFIAGVNNGWNTTSTSYGSKTGEVGISWTPSKIFSLAAQSYFGKLEAYDASRTLVDVVATYNVTSALTLIVNLDWDKQDHVIPGAGSLGDARWYGGAVYVNYGFNDHWRLSLRGEYLKDSDGFITGTSGSHLAEGTVTVGYAPVKSFELRAELRYDSTDQPIFLRDPVRGSGLPPGPAPEYNDSLSQIALQGVYKF